ncbi:type VI immunity family protein [Pyxidicoccus caerfyrddinensis]|uniref:type VI immunity family protein n=1 Tax=Pyxidicoccus caerfyrddinensis TaxID=2709663 RepID=UPI0013D9F23F|nr:type VI immunity family protein [Pyxidicoccus caerfyrddinensis]
MQYPRLRFADRFLGEAASDALLICFYMKHSHEQIAPLILRALDIFRERIQPLTLDWYIDPDAQTHPLDGTQWESIRKEMVGPEENFFPRFAGTPERVGGLYVEYKGLRIPSRWPARQHDACSLYLRLPTEFLEARGPSQVRELAVAVANELPFNSGFVDLSFGWVNPVEDAIDLIHKRYPGLHLNREGPQLDMDTHVDGVHWMNFLSQPVLGKLGGIAALRERLNLPGISIQELSGDRLLISLGDAPNPGDTEAGETLPLHRALARLLEPYLYRNTRPLGRMTPEDMRRWERRFLD